MGLIEPVQAANDWPQWRGPNRDGVLNDAGASDILSPERAEVSWRASVGPGFSSPVVADGRVIVTDALLAPASASERVLCFDEKTGQLQWEFEYAVAYPDWAFAEDQQGGPRATPVVNGGKVFTIGALGDVYCLDAATGVRVWHRSLAADYAVKEFTGITASPLIDGHVLILLVGGKPDACVLALDTGTGKEVWKALDEDASHSSPLIVSAGGERQLIVWTLQSISSLNPATGKVWWRQRLLTSADGAISSPVHDHDALLIGGLMLTLAADKPGATMLWPESHSQSHRLLSNTSTALIQDGCVYSATSNGELVCLNAATGASNWKTDKVTDKKSGASLHLSPNGGSVLIFSDKGDLIRARLTPTAYEEISRAHIIDPTFPFAGRKVVWTPPAYAHGHILARSDHELVSVSLTKQ